MTVGAAGGLNVMFKTLLNPGDEVIAFAPYFLEYGNYVRNFGGNLVTVPPNTEDFRPDPKALARKITKDTKAVIINSPNNPTGVVYSEEMIRDIAAVLEEKQREFGTSIYIVSDEPYRELAYDGVSVPWLTKYYRNTVVGYSWSKSLSLPGERIGYLVIPSEIDDYSLIYAAAGIANRILGYVNAPSLMQRVVMRCLDRTTDITPYDENRKLLYSGLREFGFECAIPQGAFYMWVKSPCEDIRLVEAAKKYRILIVPGSSFACPGYVRIAYCVSHDTIKNSLPEFRKLAEEVGLCK
jgi:aspartate aminotransferase